MSNAKAPSIAVVGANGYVGKLVVPCLSEALKQKRIKELKFLTRKSSPALEKAASENGASVCEVDYSNTDSIVKAVTGVDVLISRLLRFAVDCRHDGISGFRLGTE